MELQIRGLLFNTTHPSPMHSAKLICLIWLILFMCIDYSVIKVNTPFIQGDWNIGIERGLPQCVGALHWRTNLQDMKDWVHTGHLFSTRQELSQKLYKL